MTDRPNTRAALVERIRSTPIDGTPNEMRAAFRHILGPVSEVPLTDIGGVPCASFGDGAPLLWLHGGGLVLGDPATHARAATHVARASGRRVIVPDYPKAPEHPWPAQLDAALAVLDALDAPLPIVGDSVGGQLATLAALHRPERVSRLALISPNSDRTGLSETRHRDTATPT